MAILAIFDLCVCMHLHRIPACRNLGVILCISSVFALKWQKWPKWPFLAFSKKCKNVTIWSHFVTFCHFWDPQKWPFLGSRGWFWNHPRVLLDSFLLFLHIWRKISFLAIFDMCHFWGTRMWPDLARFGQIRGYAGILKWGILALC